jgi:P27 family predicted phage terminase small subunit
MTEDDMRGRKPKPTAQRLLEGNPGKRPLPHDEIAPAATSATFSTAPIELEGDAVATAEWGRLAPMLLRVRAVTDADRSALVALCLEWARYVEATTKLKQLGLIIAAPSGYPMPNPYLAIATRALAGCRALWPELGLTPSSRTRVTPATPGLAPGVEDEFSEFDRPRPRRAH